MRPKMKNHHVVLSRWFNERTLPWWIVAIGLLTLYVPTIVSLLRTVWSSDEQGHGPIVLGISIWLIYRKWPEVDSLEKTRPIPALAWPLIVVALACYSLGRSQDVQLLEVGSVVPLLIGIVLLVRGPVQLKSIWFALFFMVFLVPLPGTIVDALTYPMKTAVSIVAEALLFHLGYPIARSGVTLQIGQYQLLVADACAGLHTLFTLEALGLLYLNLFRHQSAIRNITLATMIVPISFTANVIRVMVLTLITYHFGDEAGQGFLHGFAGMVLFMAALGLTIAMDTLIRLFVARGAQATA